MIGRNLEGMHDLVGWSPADFEWEVFGQDPRRLGRRRPAGRIGLLRRHPREAEGRRVPAGRSDLERPRPRDIPGVLAHVALVPRQRLVVMSDQSGPIPGVLDVIAGRARSLAGSQAAADTAEALAGSDSVILQGGRLACGTTAVAPAPSWSGRRERRSSVPGAWSRTGTADVVSSIAVARASPAQRLVFAMTFGSAVVASEQASVRARLATGPFIGRSGSIDETLRLRSAGVDESTVRLDFAHDPDTDVFMTGTGPVLFATC